MNLRVRPIGGGRRPNSGTEALTGRLPSTSAFTARLSPGPHRRTQPRHHPPRAKPRKTRPGNRYTKGILGIAALSAARSKTLISLPDTNRIAARRGPVRGFVVVENALTIAAWNLLTKGDF